MASDDSANKPRTKTTSGRQRRANQQNAAKSTGPRTEAGKRRSSQNATRHGANAQSLFAIPTGVLAEDEVELKEHVDAIVRALDPRDALEEEEASQVALATIRLHRIDRFEALTIADDGAWQRFASNDTDVSGQHTSAAANTAPLTKYFPETLIRECLNFLDHLLHPGPERERDWLRMCEFVYSVQGEPIPDRLGDARGAITSDHRAEFFSLVRRHWDTEENAARWASNLIESVQGKLTTARLVGQSRASRAALAGGMEHASRQRARAERSLPLHLSIYEQLRARPLTDRGSEGLPPGISG
jgi:hypothetical protein